MKYCGDLYNTKENECQIVKIEFGYVEKLGLQRRL